MLHHKEELRYPFVSSHITNQNYLHIGDYYFRFFEKQSEMKLYADE